MSEQNPGHPIFHQLANALSLGRMAYAFKQAEELRSTEPEQRTWRDGAITAAVGLTDGADGYSARRLGSTDNGGEIDRLADVSFFGLGQVALSLNGEVSPIHPLIDVVREVAVHSMRSIAKANSQPPIKVGMRGKQKTAVKMATLTLARSPLSVHEGLIESATAIGSALSLLSGAEYSYQYFQGRSERDDQQKETTNSPRNGTARRVTESRYGKIARWLDQSVPGIKPDHITRGGELLVEGAGLLTLAKPELGFILATGPYAVGGLMDGVDGNLARHQGTDSVKGMVNDTSADKRQEIFTASINSLLAGNRGHSVAAYHYAAAAMTAALPALFRSIAETKGYIVNEDAIGSRVTRSLEGGVGLGLNRFRQISNINSALMVIGNVITAAQRADVAVRGSSSPHYRGQNNDPEFINCAKIRRNTLLPIVAGGMAVGVALIAKERISSKYRTP